MKDTPKTNSALIQEQKISALKKRIQKLEQFKLKYTQAEEKLRESEKRYENIFETSVEGIFRATGRGSFSNANPAAAHMLGYESPEELINSMTDIRSQLYVNPEDRDKTVELLLKHGSIKNFEAKCRHKNGNIIWGVLNMHLVKDSQGNILYIEGTCQDITERKLAEEALRESEERYRQLVENINKGIFVAQDGKIKFVNPMFMEILGHSEHNLTTLPFTEFIHPDDCNMVLERHIRRMKGEKFPTRYEFRILTGTGSVRWLELDSVMMQWEGKPASLAFASDITERKQVEEQLTYERQKFTILSENAPFGMSLIKKNGQFLYINPKFRDIFGYDLADIPDGKTWFRKAYPDAALRHEVVSGWLNGLNSASYGEQRPKFYNVTCKDGSIKTINFITVLLGNGDNIMVCEDITERKRLEAQLVHARKMEAVGTLSGGIAHDFNNILMGIQGYATLMMLDISTDHPHYKQLKRIEEQVKNASDLAGQLLGFARGGKYVVKPVSMNELIERTSAMFGRTKKEIVIHRKYEKGVWAVEADPGQIEQVLLNLYLNAWQAMPAGGDLSIETKNIVIKENFVKPYSMMLGRYVQISISDTGVGMDEKTKERIFEPFFTTKELGRGTGLGLAMVYGIIKSHSGFIDVISEPGKGTAFALYFPASEKEAVKEKSAAPKIMKGTETILIVDDEPDVLDVSKEILESLGYSLYAVKNGEEAITIYKQKKDEIDLIVLDMIMPGLSGSETFDGIRGVNPSAKIILSSGYSLSSQAQQIMDKGCHGFIQKPFNMADISLKIREVLEEQAVKE
jgi:PAS domain S-box-containing protein